MSKPTEINGWVFYWHQLFKNHNMYSFSGYLMELLEAVEKLQKDDPQNFHHHHTYKFFEQIDSSINNRIAPDPTNKEFLLGNTLGKKHRCWKRVKHALPPRYRLFFRYQTTPKEVVLVWLNNSRCLRKEGAKTDVYTVFAKMLKKGTVPNSIETLISESKLEEKKKA